ncbi:MAG: hypothetical protein CMM56_09050 [Rhodospirillaceae bacterium]|nr:hypothetical protein [Rhodospirillaceae bacterium]|tara:strand:+ start:196 stop:987 length:792 start_codon:yes stop_codon:yes gene_type:complete
MLKQSSFFVALILSLICSASKARTLQQVLNYGELRVGVVLDSPWVIQNQSGALLGYDIDLGNKIAEDMEVNVQFHIYEPDRLIQALEVGEIDLIAAKFSITPSRALHVNFSQPYTTNKITLATNLTSTAIADTLEDLNHADYTIAAVGDNDSAALIRQIFPNSTHHIYENQELVSAALIDGAIDGYIEEEPIPTFLSLENPTRIGVPIIEPLAQSSIGFAVAKGDADFIIFLNAWITTHESDFWLQTVHDYWFQSVRWKQLLH